MAIQISVAKVIDVDDLTSVHRPRWNSWRKRSDWIVVRSLMARNIINFIQKIKCAEWAKKISL